MKKQLLNETEIRKMMKFANIGKLTDGYISRLNENFEMQEQEGEEEEEATGGMTSPDAPMSADPDAEGGEPEMSMEPDADAGDEAMPGEDAGGDVTSKALASVKGMLDQLKASFEALGTAEAQQIADAISVEDPEGGEEPEEGEGMDVGLAEMVDEDEDGVEEAHGHGHDKEKLDEEDVTEETLNEVARRVARRLRAMRRR